MVGVEQQVTVSPDPSKVYLTFEEAMGIFVPRRMGAGETIIIPSPDGHTERTIGANDNGTAQDDMASV